MLHTVALLGAAVFLSAAAIAAPGTGAGAQAPAQFQPQQPHTVTQPRFQPASPPTREQPEEAGQGQAALNPIPTDENWSTDVQRDGPVPGSRLDAGAIEAIDRISAYFNDIDSLEGRFIQTDPYDKRMRGRFYVQRPGLLRFDYAPPSLMRIVSDGQYLSVEDHDLDTIDKYPLESTPFGMLLRRDVDLLRDAHIVNFVENDTMMAVTIEDKTGEAAGRLMLAFEVGDDSEIKFKEWIITDQQGLDTRIQLGELVAGKRMDKDFFATATVGIKLRE